MSHGLMNIVVTKPVMYINHMNMNMVVPQIWNVTSVVMNMVITHMHVGCSIC